MHRKVARLIPALGLSILIGVDIAGADWQLPPLDQVLAPEAGADSNPSTKAVSTKAASITAISFPGSTVPEAETLHALASEFIGQSTNRQQLERLRQRVNHLYQQLGMPGSGALMPRHLDSGHIEVPVVEGRLGVVEVIGLEGEDRAYIAQALDGLREEPLSRGRMLDRLRALEQSPGIESVQGELLPTTTLGVVDLRLRIVRANAWSSVWSLDNKRSPSVGGEQAGLSLTAMPLGDLSHTLNLQLGLHGDGGGGRFGLGYEHALNGPLSAVGFSLSRDDASLVEAPFDALDIDSRSDSFTLHAYQRAFPSENTEQRLGASFSLQRSRSRLLGRAFSFSPGE
ncbi:MAG: POTRA domain-containing protein, partial [Gammaproteobacteria bacterium]